MELNSVAHIITDFIINGNVYNSTIVEEFEFITNNNAYKMFVNHKQECMFRVLPLYAIEQNMKHLFVELENWKYLMVSNIDYLFILKHIKHEFVRPSVHEIIRIIQNNDENGLNELEEKIDFDTWIEDIINTCHLQELQFNGYDRIWVYKDHILLVTFL